MAEDLISTDYTHVGSVGNPSGLKKASGDSSSGVDVPTLNAVAVNLVVNGMVDVSAIQMIEKSTQSHLNNDKITSVSSSQATDQRSDKINELVSGMPKTNFKSTEVSSLGDMMCQLMVLMIQNTSERKKMEREMRTVLVTTKVGQSEEIAKEIMDKMKIEVQQKKEGAIIKLAATSLSMGVSVGFMARSSKGKSFTKIQGDLGNEKLIGSSASQLASAFGNFATVDGIKEIAKFDASIASKKALMSLTQSVANSVETSLNSIDSTREFFLSMMQQIAQMQHEGVAQITRNI